MNNNHIGLGKGLSAIMGEISLDESPSKPQGTAEIRRLPLSKLFPGKFQPRHVFGPDELADLVSSIRAKGVLQPLLVRPRAEDPTTFEIIAGERRWRASQAAGIPDVPVIVRDFSDKETLEVALIENLQRQNLNPLEEAIGYQRLMSEFHHTQAELATAIGKSRPYIANTVRLLDLPDSVKHYVEQGDLSAGHARALLNAANPEKLARKIVEHGLNVRQAEQLAVSEGEKKPRAKKTIALGGKKDNDIMGVESEISALLKTNVSIKWNGKNGKIVIDCNSLDKMDQVLQRLTVGGPVDDTTME